MEKLKTVFLEPLGVADMPEKVRAALGDRCELCFYPDRNESPEALIERCRGADIAVLSNIPFRREVIDACPRLKMICVAFTGVDHIDMERCRERGITVCNCSGYSTSSVSELVFGLVFALLRRLIPCDGAVRRAGTKNGLIGEDLDGKTFGVVGAGAIGSKVAAVARAFGCRVLIYSRTEKDVPGASFVSLDELLSQSDIVSLHVPQTAETRGMIGARELSLMKKSALLINTARGPIVDENALAQALARGDIAGAGIDVFSAEPPIDPASPILSAPNTVLTPHVGFATEQAFVKRLDIVCRNIESFSDGAPQNVVK